MFVLQNRKIRFFVCLLICFMLVFCVYTQPAQAIAPVVAVAGYGLVAAACVAAGFVFSENEQVQAVTTSVLDSMSEQAKRGINTVNAIATGIGYVTYEIGTGLWDGIMSVRDGILSGTTTELTYEGVGSTEYLHWSMAEHSYTDAIPDFCEIGEYLGTYTFDFDITGGGYNRTVKIYGIKSDGSELNIAKATYTYTGGKGLKIEVINGDGWHTIFHELGTTVAATLTIDNVTGDITTYSCNDTTITNYYSLPLNGNLSGSGMSVDVCADMSGLQTLPVGDIDIDYGKVGATSGDGGSLVGQTITVPESYVTGDDVLGLSENIANTVDVPVVSTGVPTVGDMDVPIGEETAWLQQIWSNTSTTAAAAAAAAGSLATIADTSTDLDFNKYNDIDYNVFTTRFPFSLPWDLKRSFESFEGSETIPEWHFDWMGADVEFSFDWFVDWLPKIRLVELILFDICLIMATRRLLGGGA